MVQFSGVRPGGLKAAKRYIENINKKHFQKQLKALKRTMGEYNEKTYRQKLLDLVGDDYASGRAHHMIPQQFRDVADEALGEFGLSIDHPWFTTMLDNTVHTAVHSAGFNQYWAAFLASGGKTALEIVDFALDMANLIK